MEDDEHIQIDIVVRLVPPLSLVLNTGGDQRHMHPQAIGISAYATVSDSVTKDIASVPRVLFCVHYY